VSAHTHTSRFNGDMIQQAAEVVWCMPDYAADSNFSIVTNEGRRQSWPEAESSNQPTQFTCITSGLCFNSSL